MKKAIRLKPVKWRWYFRPKVMKWIRECEHHMNSEEIQAKIKQITISKATGA